jgi:DNA-binding response OmpR family regulator
MASTSGKERVLVVDDDRAIVDTVAAYLEGEGFETVRAYDGRAALDKFRSAEPSIVILDLMLPGVSGYEVARGIRSSSAVPIIMLTARVSEEEKLRGLDLGADDYVTKPFSVRELTARVRAVLRRAGRGPDKRARLEVDGLAVDLETREATKNGTPLKLTPTEFALLQVLMENQGHVLTRLQLIEKALGYTYDGYERTIDAHIKNVRHKIEDDPRNPKHLLTVFGIGYKFA